MGKWGSKRKAAQRINEERAAEEDVHFEGRPRWVPKQDHIPQWDDWMPQMAERLDHEREVYLQADEPNAIRQAMETRHNEGGSSSSGAASLPPRMIGHAFHRHAGGQVGVSYAKRRFNVIANGRPYIVRR